MIGVYGELIAGLLFMVWAIFHERQEWADYRDTVESAIWHAAFELEVDVEAVRDAVLNVMPDGQIIWRDEYYPDTDRILTGIAKASAEVVEAFSVMAQQVGQMLTRTAGVMQTMSWPQVPPVGQLRIPELRLITADPTKE